MNETILNIWYMAGWADELTEGLVARKLLGTPIVMFRGTSGAAVAMLDRCPHRFAPLSRGQLNAGVIRCGYHALEYDEHGICIKNRFAQQPPAGVRVRTFPIVERDTILWIWPGDAELADPSLIPSFPYLTDPAYKTANGYSYIRASYMLITDNLMDLSHVDMLHPNFGGILDRGKFIARHSGLVVESNWFTQSVPPTTNLVNLWQACPEVVDHWFDMTWRAPGAMILDVGVTHPGQPRSEGFSHPSLHVVTPEAKDSTHYFWNAGLAHDHPLDIGMFRDILAHAFDQEDRPMLEAVASRMEEQPLEALGPISLPTDNGAVRVRRILAELAAQDRTPRTRPAITDQPGNAKQAG